MPESILHSPFNEVAALLVLAALLGFVGTLLRQPLIVSFIAVGLVAGPGVLDIVRSDEQIELLSELGIAVLLFLVGIKLDVKLIRSLGRTALVAGIVQIVVTTAVGYAVALALGLAALPALYVAVALTFSSTIIVVKLLSDRREIESLHGQVALGLLIVQDLVVVLAMIVLSAVGIGSGEASGNSALFRIVGGGAAVLAFVFLFVRFIADPLTARLARAPELLICFAIAQTALFAAIGEAVGFGRELGGLLAGVSLASTQYREAISSRLAPVRDFLLLFFFIALGSRIELETLAAHAPVALVLSVFVLAGKPLIMLLIMAPMGFDKRTAFLAGVSIAQISEFSLILVAMGATLGHIGGDVLGLVTLVALVTIAASTYMMARSHRLYASCEPLLGPFDRIASRSARSRAASPVGEAADVIIFGLGRFGAAIAARLRRRGARVLGVDFNPAVIERWRSLGFDAQYGDSTDAEFIATLPLQTVNWAVSTVPTYAPGITYDDPRIALCRALRLARYAGHIAVTTHHAADVDGLKLAGADLVLEPFQDAADQAVDLITSGASPTRVRNDYDEAQELGG